jgi:hypothetical protein
MRARAGRHALAIAVGALMLCVGTVTHGAEPPWKLDEQAAQRLAAKAYGHGKDPKWFDYGPGMSSPFFVFYGLNQTDGGFGYFAVNPWTGDVWALWGCHKLSTPALRKSLAEIRRRFTLEELKQYRRLANLKPECI